MERVLQFFFPDASFPHDQVNE